MEAFFSYIYFNIWLVPFALFILLPFCFLAVIFIVFFVSNMREGSKNKWPKRNMVGASVFGSLLTLSIAVVIVASAIYFRNFPLSMLTGGN